MRRLPLLLIHLLLFATEIVHAQKYPSFEPGEVHPVDKRMAIANFKKEYVGTTIEQVSAYLTRNIRNLDNEGSSVVFVNKTVSKKGFHFLFHQQYNHKNIYRAGIKVNVDQSGYLTSLFDYSYDTDTGFMSTGVFPSSQTAGNFLRGRNYEWYKFEETYFFDGEKFLNAGRIELMGADFSYFESIIDVQGNELYHNDLVSYNCPPPPFDSLVSGYVFLPDPLTTAGVGYGTPYIDDGDSDLVILNAQRVLASFYASFDSTDSSFTLKSPYVNIVDLFAPNNPPAKKDTAFFNFTRSQQEFEEVNAFYHLSVFQSHMQDLGYNLVDYAIDVDAHGLTGDNSMFVSGAIPPRLLFGDGGVDDAEDADVILHEYGHAVMFSAAPGTNSGTERKSLDEANGDYFASSYSRFLNPFQWENVFSWDGHNQFWPGRSSVSNKHYPEHISSNFYTMTDIWSATLMQIWGDIGRDATDELLLESAYSYSSGMSMADAAILFMNADTLLNAGVNSPALLNRFITRGLIADTTTSGVKVEELYADHIQVRNTWGFATGSSPLIIEFEKQTNATLELYSSQGILIRREQLGNTKTYSFYRPPIPSGIYVLNILTPQKVKTTKLIKF
jgi:hypothetical protein